MRAHRTGWRIGVALLALGVCLLVTTSRDRAAENKKNAPKPFLPETEFDKLVEEQVKIIQDAPREKSGSKKARDATMRNAALLIALAAENYKGDRDRKQLATIRDSALNVVHAVAHGNAKTVILQVKRLANFKELKADANARVKPVNVGEAFDDTADVMRVFGPRGRGGQGIEADIDELVSRSKPFSTRELSNKTQSEKLLLMAYKTSLLAEATRGRVDDVSEKEQKHWRTWSDDSRTASLELAEAVKAKEGKRVTSAVAKVNDSCIRCHDAFKISKGRSNPSIAALIKGLHDQDPSTRSSAAITLAGYGAEAAAAVPLLIKTLRDRDQDVRRSAARSLAQLGLKTETAIPAVNTAMKDEDDYIRFWFAYKLKGVRAEAKKLVPVLVEVLKLPDDELCSKAAELLGCLGPEAKSAVPALEERLKDTNADVRRAAAAALMHIRTEGAIPALIQSLKDKDPVIRGRAGVALAHMGKAAVPALRDALKGEDRPVRGAAAYALGRIGAAARPAVPALMDMLKSKDTYLRTVAANALKKIDPEAAAGAGVK